MMTYVSLISFWTLSLFVLLSSSSTQFRRTDPTDDFSFSLNPIPGIDSYHLMSSAHIGRILADRLDLFPRSLSLRLGAHIHELCKRYRFDPAFILSLMEVESTFRTKAVSPLGALGLMQIRIPTAQFILKKLGPIKTGYENFEATLLGSHPISEQMLFDPFTNTALGIAYLAWLRDHPFGKRPSFYALAAYNVGPNRLHDLLSRRTFKPVETKKYYQSIRKHVPHFRYYRGEKLS